MSCFSLPCGYLACTVSTRASLPATFCRASAASGLLSSTPMYSAFAPTIFAARRRPSSTASASSSITRWSALKNGSHSAPLRMTVSMGLSLGGESLTWVGNVAPPMPTTPAARMAASNWAGSSAFSTGAMDASHSSRPSFSMMTEDTRRPPAIKRGWMALTLPETGAWTAALTKPSASPIFCPRHTRSPGLTSGLQGAPACCTSGTAANSGAGMTSMGLAPVARFSSTPSRGCTPRRKLNILPNALSPIFRASPRYIGSYISQCGQQAEKRPYFPVGRLSQPFRSSKPYA